MSPFKNKLNFTKLTITPVEKNSIRKGTLAVHPQRGQNIALERNCREVLPMPSRIGIGIGISAMHGPLFYSSESPA
ncbi:hypothetical protein [Pseudomonas syringae group genomosp. 7]|uniref:Uncharacterized protein n=1 Tax=Pseudomonas syringae pv. tagetis TaxID=129140 RepID=A0ABW7NSX6_9PSED|nr:hypothetical protein [Pseudomonas syringae group genomosp. 7]